MSDVRPSSPEPASGADSATGAPGDQVHEIGNRTYIIADVEPLDVDGVRFLAVGTTLWALAFLALLPFYDRLGDSGNLWWLWTCAAGVGLGLYGWEYCRRRRRDRLAARHRAPDTARG